MNRLLLSFAFALSLFVAGCGGGGSTTTIVGFIARQETEPNDAAATANSLAPGIAGTGTIAAGDLDFWALTVSAGQLVSVELVAARLDQTGWDTNCNVPELTLWASDGTTRLLQHDVTAGWMLGSHDLDFPLVRITTTGTYYLCVAAMNGALPGGRYALTVNSRSEGSVQNETEAAGQTGVNDGPLSAQAIGAGTIAGSHDEANADWYRFTLAAPSVVCFEIMSSRNGLARNEIAYYEPRLNLYAADGATLMATADGVYFNDPLLCARVAPAGTYFLEVTQAAAGGDADYLLSYVPSAVDALPTETEPNDSVATADGVRYGDSFGATTSTADTDVFAFAGVAGDAILVEALPAVVGTAMQVVFLGTDGVTVLPSDSDTAGGILAARTLLTTSGVHYFRVTSVSGSAIAYSVSFARRNAGLLETEPNNTLANGKPLDANGRGTGVIASAGDVDVWRLDAEENELVVVSILARRVVRGGIGSDGWRLFSGNGSALKPRLRALDAAGGQLAVSRYTAPNGCVGVEDVLDGQPTLAVAFVAPAKGTYYVEVAAEDGTGGAGQFYLVRRR